jgi:hypothetical protein
MGKGSHGDLSSGGAAMRDRDGAALVLAGGRVWVSDCSELGQ